MESKQPTKRFKVPDVYTDEETELLVAAERFKRENHRSFLSFTEVLTILKGIGYRKCEQPEPEGLSLHAVIETFLQYVKFQKAENTVLAYRKDLARFEEFCSMRQITQLNQVSIALVQDFLVQLSGTNKTAKTVNRYLATVKSLFKFAVLRGHLQANPISAIERAKEPKKIPRVLTVEQVKKLLDVEVSQPERYYADQDTMRLNVDYNALLLRDQAICEVLAGTGVRVGELLNLKLGDIDSQNALVRVFGKGSKERVVPASKRTVQAVRRYLTKGRPVLAGKRKSKIIFVSCTGRPMVRRDVSRLLKKRAVVAGLPGDLHPHDLRHSYATSLLNAGMNLASIQALLGHADISTTGVYLHTSTAQLKKDFRKFDPLK